MNKGIKHISIIARIYIVVDRRKWEEIQKLQKGTHIMSLIHKPLEDIIVYLLYDMEFIGADHVSLVTYILAALTAYLFLAGEIGKAIVMAILVGILDGVDGKIARLRKRKTYIGKLEHSIDMLYEQAWYAAFIWASWSLTGSIPYLVAGIIWLILDSFVRHVYHVVWIATGKSLKYHGGVARYVTFIDGRRSMYVLHMLIWYLVGMPFFAIYTILGHCALTALSYTVLAFKIMLSHE
ncbi:MAG: hypothetical protein DRN15_09125 [Thermoprotei archaeon]|nr:MAG: hypothetical protein DRN15_09125 [Thermoprotei archaeon]RLF25345.1 MAG: hypothetical protein DRM97_02185 [Thermoprotei archaeon]